MVAALACLCCLLGFCALICCRSDNREEEEDVREEEEEEDVREEKAANVHNVFAEVKEENVKDEKPFMPPPQTQPRSFLARLVPNFSILKPVMRPLRPLFGKIRTIRPPPPLLQTTNGMTQPIQLVQTTTVAPKLMMQPQSQAMVGTILLLLMFAVEKCNLFMHVRASID